jgi:predicted lipid-binding transport protein (Tim44 family)
MKKLFAMFIALTVMFSSAGSVILLTEDHVVEAKSYKSGKKSYNNNQNQNSNIQNSDTTKNNNTTNNTTNKSTSKDATKADDKKGGFFSGGLMKGLMIGGLAGLLFGSLFGDLGMLGNLLGFAINAIAIVFIVIICIKIVQFFTRKKNKDEDRRQWNN